MDFVKNLKVTPVVEGRGMGVMLFVSFRLIAYENRYVIHPLYLNTFATIEKLEPRNHD